MKKPVQVCISSVLKACRPRDVNISSSSSPSPTTSTSRRLLLPGPPQLARVAATEVANISPYSSYGNPCLDLFFHVRPPNPPNVGYAASLHKPEVPYSHKYLKHLLPLAWSHSPLTTLKLIFNLLDRREGTTTTGKNDREGFFTAAYWLYQNHPNTLAFNVAPIAGSFGNLNDLLELLHRTLEGQGVRLELDIISKGIEWGPTCSRRRRREKILAMAKKALERYRRDPNYRLLHDAVSDLYAQCLKSDVQNLNNYHQHHHHGDHDEYSSSKFLEITSAAKWCPHVDSSYDLATLLCESIAKKVFPRESEYEGDEVEEADYAYRVRERLRKEVLLPLRNALESRCNDHESANQWAYDPAFKPEPCAIKKYLEEVMKALARGGCGESDKIIKEAGSLLPNEIVGHVNDGDVGQAAELQWKTMVEDIYQKQQEGKLKNCLAVIEAADCRDIGGMMSAPSWDAVVALAVLASQLSEEPWKGNIIFMNNTSKPQLHSIQSLLDLKSKCEFVNSFSIQGKNMDFQNARSKLEEVFDLILKVAVKENLKPEQMVNKVFVLTAYQDFYCSDSSVFSYGCSEERDFEVIHTKFKDKGYGDVVPQAVFWNLNNRTANPVRSTTQGAVMLGGFSNNLLKSFLDNDGDIRPEHVMEAAIAGEEYENLVVVD